MEIRGKYEEGHDCSFCFFRSKVKIYFTGMCQKTVQFCDVGCVIDAVL